MPWIFSYAELGPGVIESVLPNAPFCALPATLDSHTLTFKGKSRKWGGGIATISRKKGGVTYGSVYLVPESEVKLIDKYYKLYDKTLVKVNIAATGDTFKALTYILQKGEDSNPSDEYCKALVKHLKFFWGQGGKNLKLSDFGIEISGTTESNTATSQQNETTKPKRSRKSKANVEQ